MQFWVMGFLFNVLKVTLTKPKISMSGNPKCVSLMSGTTKNLYMVTQSLSLTSAFHMPSCLIFFLFCVCNATDLSLVSKNCCIIVFGNSFLKILTISKLPSLPIYFLYVKLHILFLVFLAMSLIKQIVGSLEHNICCSKTNIHPTNS